LNEFLIRNLDFSSYVYLRKSDLAWLFLINSILVHQDQ